MTARSTLVSRKREQTAALLRVRLEGHDERAKHIHVHGVNGFNLLDRRVGYVDVGPFDIRLCNQVNTRYLADHYGTPDGAQRAADGEAHIVTSGRIRLAALDLAVFYFVGPEGMAGIAQVYGFPKGDPLATFASRPHLVEFWLFRGFFKPNRHFLAASGYFKLRFVLVMTGVSDTDIAVVRD